MSSDLYQDRNDTPTPGVTTVPVTWDPTPRTVTDVLGPILPSVKKRTERGNNWQ